MAIQLTQAPHFSGPRIFVSVATRFIHRRLISTFALQLANKRFFYTLAFWSILAAKIVHIHAHANALGKSTLILWSLTFLTQDVALLLYLRLLLDDEIYTNAGRWIKGLARAAAFLVVLFVMIVGAINVSFFAVTGSEIHWRNIGFAGEKSSLKVLVSGLVACSFAVAANFFLSWVMQDLVYITFGVALNFVKWPVVFLKNKIPALRTAVRKTVGYSHVPQYFDDETEEVRELLEKEEAVRVSHCGTVERLLLTKLRVPLYVLVGSVLFAQIVLSIARPNEVSLSFMSWTLPLLPVIDFTQGSQSISELLPYYGTSINHNWDTKSALTDPIPYPWLPDDKLPGFEDWYDENKTHYSAAKDPLKIANMDEELLPGLQGLLSNVSIRHVMLIKLESTRKDIFPIKKDGFMAGKFADSFNNQELPEEVSERLSTLTPTANFLTGDYDDGFEHAETPQRGGLNCKNAFTTATYTRKSMTGTLCGITPLVQDFNVEFLNHIYQPCLPQIFGAFNELDPSSENETVSFNSYKWRSSMMQSTTDSYDREHDQMPFLGYTTDDYVYKEYLKSDKAKFGPVDLPDINYYGMAEVAIEDYVRDAFVQAKEKNERLFLTHLTSTAHHPFNMPEEEEYVPLSEDPKLNDLSHYANAIGYVDRWIAKILSILEEEEVADETLIVFVGDHGISIAETDAITPYYNPNIGNFHVPLVLSHPQLPTIDIDAPVESLQILPTILDLLQETGSLSPLASEAARDLARNYEGQSLIRPIQSTSTKSGLADWKFTVMNPGGAMLSVRSSRHPNLRLVVPVVDNIEWRFTDLESDPHESQPTVAFSFFAFLQVVEERYGIEKAQWAEEAAFVSRWWVAENKKRYRYPVS